MVRAPPPGYFWVFLGPVLGFFSGVYLFTQEEPGVSEPEVPNSVLDGCRERGEIINGRATSRVGDPKASSGAPRCP